MKRAFHSSVCDRCVHARRKAGRCSVNQKFSLRRRANQWFIGHWLYHGSRSNVSETRYILRARRTLKTEWRVSQELRSAPWSLPVSPIDQRCATAPILLARLGMVGLFGCCRLACQIRLDLVARWLATKMVCPRCTLTSRLGLAMSDNPWLGLAQRDPVGSTIADVDRCHFRPLLGTKAGAFFCGSELI